MMVKMQHSVQRGFQGYCLSLSGGFSACPVASRLLGLPGGSGGFSACQVASRLLGFSACVVLHGFSACVGLLGFSASGRISGPLLPVLWQMGHRKT